MDIWSVLQTSLRKLFMNEVELSLYMQHGRPKYAKMLELSALMTVFAGMSFKGSSKMNLLKLSLQQRM